MKKTIVLTVCIAAAAVCAIAAYNRAAESDTSASVESATQEGTAAVNGTAGKTVIPFCTHGGSRFSGAVETIRQLEPKATVLDGHAIARDRVDGSRDGVLRWLEKIGMRK